ncbi:MULTISPECIES: hypothetical protein [Pseudoalteromonas]|uniref:hypothetical protein n=1 Tax=Pseudoalteromonas TaxID=53246 RepID=UPI0002FE4549|nr:MULTISPECIES: hypothetical protein [Pseudoalteromonas]MCF6145263.1 hypothetical protein [Pseudoalteromonas mariniglutinosa NCIMB 1770]
MKKFSAINEVHRYKRLKKHIKKSKSRKKRLRKVGNIKRAKRLRQVDISDSELLRKFYDGNVHRSKILPFSNANIIKLPKNFSLYDNTEKVFETLDKFTSLALLASSGTKFEVNHKSVRKTCLTSEFLLGLFAKEISLIKDCGGQLIDFKCKGVLPNKRVLINDIVSEVGIASELDAKVVGGVSSDTSKIHVFKDSCKLVESATADATDHKNKVANRFIEHISEALADHRLCLNDDASDMMKGCLGEIIDNIEEHSGLTAPNWYIRGYVNNNHKNKMLEFTVVNIGKSIFDTFNDLPDGNYSKEIVREYCDLHHGKGISKEALTTVASLQGSISSKNFSDKDTRGHGTIKLIETFEEIHRDYLALRCPTDKNSLSNMLLVSGSTVIKFDGTYKSETLLDKNGDGERVIFPFNNEGLRGLPDSDYVITMNKMRFPGTIISIQIPLSGSTVPIKDCNNE